MTQWLLDPWKILGFSAQGLFFYALHIKDPVFTLGQGMGLLVYVRNLMLVKWPRRQG